MAVLVAVNPLRLTAGDADDGRVEPFFFPAGAGAGEPPPLSPPPMPSGYLSARCAATFAESAGADDLHPATAAPPVEGFPLPLPGAPFILITKMEYLSHNSIRYNQKKLLSTNSTSANQCITTI